MAAGISNNLPSSGFGAQSGYTIEGQPIDKWKLKFAGFAITYGDYFRAMGIQLLDGRTFTAEDRSDAPLVIIVNESLAKHPGPASAHWQENARWRPKKSAAVGNSGGRGRRYQARRSR